MSKLLPPLEILSQQHPDVIIQELASNLRAVIATHGAYRPDSSSEAISVTDAPPPRNHKTAVKNVVKGEANDSHKPAQSHERLTASSGGSGISPGCEGQISGSSDSCPPSKPISDWLIEACDPDVPTRAYALRVLTQMVQHRKPEAIQAQEKILTVSYLVAALFVCFFVLNMFWLFWCFHFFLFCSFFFFFNLGFSFLFVCQVE